MREEKNAEKTILQLKVEEQKLHQINLEKEAEIVKLKVENRDELSVPTTTRQETTKTKLPQLPLYTEGTDLEQYLSRFERYFSVTNFDESKKAVILASYLQGKSLEVFHKLPEQDCHNYEILKSALLKRYNITAAKCRQDFKNIKLEDDESFSQLQSRMEQLLSRWIKSTGKSETFEDLFALVIEDQMMRVFPQDLKIFLKERGFDNNEEMVKYAERWRSAHSGQVKNPRGKSFEPTSKLYNDQNKTSRSNDLNNRRPQNVHNMPGNQQAAMPQNFMQRPMYGQSQMATGGQKNEQRNNFCYTCQLPHDHRTCHKALDKKRSWANQRGESS